MKMKNFIMPETWFMLFDANCHQNIILVKIKYPIYPFLHLLESNVFKFHIFCKITIRGRKYMINRKYRTNSKWSLESRNPHRFSRSFENLLKLFIGKKCICICASLTAISFIIQDDERAGIIRKPLKTP